MSCRDAVPSNREFQHGPLPIGACLVVLTGSAPIGECWPGDERKWAVSAAAFADRIFVGGMIIPMEDGTLLPDFLDSHSHCINTLRVGPGKDVPGIIATLKEYENPRYHGT